MIRAAGILFITGNKVLLVRRSGEGDYAGDWAFPGGKVEDGETPEDAAIRECNEELGACPEGARVLFARRQKDGVDYTTFLQRVTKPFTPALNDEHEGFMWAEIDEWPSPLHPGAKIVLDKLTMNELQIAKAMVAGDLTSPQFYHNIGFFAIRIFGTGVAYRVGEDEYTYRSPDVFLTDEFVERCNGLPVIWEHPETDKPTLTSDEFADRVVGTIILPYISGDEIWGIAKIYDDIAKSVMENEQVSTSPSVVFRGGLKNKTIELDNGDRILVEGAPDLLDHLAICEQGVWDKAESPSGVVSATVEDSKTSTEGKQSMDDNMPAPEMSVADKARKDAEDEAMRKETEEKARKDAEEKVRMDADGGEPLDRILKHLESLHSRMDALEAKGRETEPRKDAEPTPMKERAEPASGTAPPPSTEHADAKAKRDAEEKEEMEKEEMRKRLDAYDKKLKSLEDSTRETPEEDQAKYTETQTKADSVLQLFGKQAGRPLRGETVTGYRKRMLKPLQAHSPKWGAVDLGMLTKQVLDIAEAEIYADAQKAGLKPTDVPRGKFREIARVDPHTGQRVITFHGSNTIFSQMGRKPRYVTRISATHREA